MERELIAITDSLLIEEKGAKSDKMCYFKSTGTSNPETMGGMFKNTWLPCLGVIKFPDGCHLVKGSCVRGRLALDTLYTVCSVFERKDPTFYQQALSITDTKEKKDKILKLFTYFNTWRQMQISIILSDSVDFWSNNEDIKTLILSCSYNPDEFPWNHSLGYKDTLDEKMNVTESNIDFFTHNPEYDFFRRLIPYYKNSYMKGLTPPGFDFKLSIEPETPVSAVITPISEPMPESTNQEDSDDDFNQFATYKRDSSESPVDSKGASSDASTSDPKSVTDQGSKRYDLRTRKKGGTRRSRRRLKRSRRK